MAWWGGFVGLVRWLGWLGGVAWLVWWGGLVGLVGWLGWLGGVAWLAWLAWWGGLVGLVVVELGWLCSAVGPVVLAWLFVDPCLLALFAVVSAVSG